MPPRRAAIMETEVRDMAGTDRLLEAIDKMTLALQELREAVLELTAEETAAEPAPAPVPEPETVSAPPAEPASASEEGRCPVCGEPVKPGSRFCMSCGASIPAAGEAEAAPAPEPVTISEPVLEPVTVWQGTPATEPEAAPAEKRCPACGEPVKPGSRFCMSCGASIPAAGLASAPAPSSAQRAFCMNCGAPLRPGDKFCMKCGQRTGA